ncbi:hypothetical protein JM16_009540, partial [Phytophthora kernoviae]
MRLSCFLFVAATALLASTDTVTATSDVDHVALSKVDSVHSATVINGNGNNDGNRFLRTSKAIEDDNDDDSEEDLEDDTEDDTEDGSEDEERSFMDILKSLPFYKLDDIDTFKNAPLNKFDDIAKDLSYINPGALEKLEAHNVKVFEEIKGLGWTPDTLSQKLGGNVILKNVSGVFKPGKITLLLDQPGSGKSALMKMFSGRFPVDKNITVGGDISFNNVPKKQIIDRLPQFVSYVDQRDKHFAPLSVKEILEFAYK